MRKGDMRKRLVAVMRNADISPNHWGMTPETEKLELEVLRGVDKLALAFPDGLSQWEFSNRLEKLETFIALGGSDASISSRGIRPHQALAE